MRLVTIRNCALAFAMAGFCSLGAIGQDTANQPPSSEHHAAKESSMTSDHTFVKKAAEGGLAEVQLGQLASEKAASPEVKQFGQRMVTDHTQANDQLKQIAQQQGIELPTKLNAKDAATKARLEKLSGKAFDRAYMSDMVKDHTKDVAEFQREAKAGKNPAVKNFAAETTPKLEDHLKEAKNIAPKVGAESTSSAARNASGY